MKKPPIMSKLIALGCLFFLIILLPDVTASAHEATAQPRQTPLSAPQHSGPTDPAELKAFLDAFFAEKMEAVHIPGAVVIFVKDGEIFLAKGYGLADLENQIQVDPNQTLFRAGSVSKLFTATAIMQLAEQGRLDLGDPANQYLEDFQLEDNYPDPVTVANLLTHTGGFDEQMAGMGTHDPSSVIPLGEYLAANMPPRVMPPDDQISYSNHGFALAGYLVEELSSIPFAQYVDENIFQPLGMSRSSFEEPMPAHLAPDMATGYAYANGAYQPLPLDLLNVAPAGSLYTTGTDMARFMIAHLQDGRYEEGRILEKSTAQEMHQQQFTHHPQLDGWAYGFYEHEENGQRAIAHGGDITGFSSLLFLLPDENTGFFVSFNTSLNPLAGGGDPRNELVSQFLDHYYPAIEEPASPASAMTASDLQRLTGNYRWNRYSRTTLEKGLPPMPLLQFHITANGDGTLMATPPLGMGEATRWAAIEPLLFQSVDGEGYMAFREDENGRITHQFLSFMGMSIAAEKVAWYETDSFQTSLLGFFTLIFLSALAWPVAALFRRLRKRPVQFTRRERQARALAAAVAVLDLLFLIGLVVRLGQAFTGVFNATPAYFVALLVIPLLTAVLTIGLLVFTVLAWKDRYWSTLGRVHYSLITVAALAFTWFMDYWNLLGWKL
ncbi:MAG: beta-lactamase family protein [Chloroflexi bacterium]|nr:beta-lactamase family protein [Chloroflexota bacterium]